MSWLDQYLSKGYKAVGDVTSNLLNGAGDAAKYFGGPAGSVASSLMKGGSQFVKSEFADKSDLRAAQVLGFGSGFPILGGIINGLQGATQMEDLYNNTGKVPAYGGLQNLGSGGIGAAAGSAMRIADGSHDLYRYYAGEPDQWSINLYG